MYRSQVLWGRQRLLLRDAPRPADAGRCHQAARWPEQASQDASALPRATRQRQSARTMLTLVPSRHCPKAQGQQQLVPAMRHARCAGGRSTPKCQCELRRAVLQPPVARKILNGTERRWRAARAIRHNGNRGWGTMQANRSKPALVCVTCYARCK